MEKFSRKCLQDAYKSWLSSRAPDDAIAVTVTLKTMPDGRQLGERAASNAVGHYSRALNAKAFGRQYRRRERQLTFIAVQEGGSNPSDKHLHYHLLVEVPSGWTVGEWMQLAGSLIGKVRCFGEQFVVKPVRDSGWLDYILKDQDRVGLADRIDAETLWISA